MHIGKRIHLKIPSRNDIELIRHIWCDEETMESVGGIVNYNEKQMYQWYERLLSGTDKYFLIFSNTKQCIGEISIHRINEHTGEGEFNIKIVYKYRNRGYAKEAIKLFINYLDKDTDIVSLKDEILKTNTDAAKLLEEMGFNKTSETGRTIVYRKLIKNQKSLI